MSKVRVKRYPDRPCRNCGKSFSPITSWMVYCSDDCHDLFWKTKNPMAKIAKIEKRLDDLEEEIKNVNSN